jgi:hypothetical protein
VTHQYRRPGRQAARMAAAQKARKMRYQPEEKRPRRAAPKENRPPRAREPDSNGQKSPPLTKAQHT